MSHALLRMSSRKIRFSKSNHFTFVRAAIKVFSGYRRLRVHLRVNSVYDLTSLFRVCCWRGVYATLSTLQHAFLSDGLLRPSECAIMLSHLLTSTFSLSVQLLLELVNIFKSVITFIFSDHAFQMQSI